MSGRWLRANGRKLMADSRESTLGPNRGRVRGAAASSREETAPQNALSDYFVLPPELRAEIVDHALVGYPEEVCGVIAGTGGVAVALFRGRNVSPTPRTTYQLDVETLARQIAFEDAGLILAAIYHSHPCDPGEPSPMDIRLAYYPDSLYIICGLTDQGEAVVRGFRIVEGEVREVTLIS